MRGVAQASAPSPPPPRVTSRIRSDGRMRVSCWSYIGGETRNGYFLKTRNNLGVPAFNCARTPPKTVGRKPAQVHLLGRTFKRHERQTHHDAVLVG